MSRLPVRRPSASVATEHAEQAALVRWSELASHRHPELRLLHAIPNGGNRNIVTAKKLKAEGVKPGVPDLCLPVPIVQYAGLYIELKRRKGGRLSDEQTWWIAELRRQGYRVEVCRGWDKARAAIETYLGIRT